jgi:hypothetical protein
MLNGFSAVQNAVLNPSGGSAPIASGFVVSPTPPSDHTVAWLQLDSLGRPTRLYFFAQGAWLSLHPTNSGLTMWWFNALPDFTTFDGGDGTSPTPTPLSGPMWQQALDANNKMIVAQFPVAAGAMPSPSTTVLSVPGSGGYEKVQLVAAEIAPHIHVLDNVGINAQASGNTVNHTTNGLLAGDRNNATSVPGVDILTKNNVGDGSSVTAQGHNNMPPYVVGYLLQRTIRLYYRV